MAKPYVEISAKILSSMAGYKKWQERKKKLIVAKIYSYEKRTTKVYEGCSWTNTLVVHNHILMNKTII